MQYELYHHGILGMKWGIRRYQNKDGSLTAAGKKRYRSQDAANIDKELENISSANKTIRRDYLMTDFGGDAKRSMQVQTVQKFSKDKSAQKITDIVEDYYPEAKQKRLEYEDLMSQFMKIQDEALDKWRAEDPENHDESDIFFEMDMYKDKQLMAKMDELNNKMESIHNDLVSIGKRAADEMLGVVGNEKITANLLTSGRNRITKREQLGLVLQPYKWKKV